MRIDNRFFRLCCLGPLALLTLLLAAGPARAGEGSWTRFGPGNGEITAFTADPELADTVYVAHQNGGVYKSVDGGVRFAGPLRALGKVQVGALGAFRGALFAFDQFGRFLRSDDHGVRWQTLHRGQAFRDLPLRQDPASLEGAELFFTPDASPVYYLKLRFGVYRSTDEGRTWERILAGEPEIGAFAFDPTAPDTLHAGLFDDTLIEGRGGLVKSTDGGDTWIPVAVPDFSHGGVQALAVLATRPATVLAVNANAELFRSPDGGATWQQVPFPKALASRGFELAADPVDPRRVYLAWAFFGFHVSRDAGLTWEGADGVSGVPMPGLIDFDASGRWIYLPGANGVARRPHGAAPGAKFKVVYRPNFFESNQVGKVEFDPAHPNRLLVTGDVLVASPDLGRSWALPGSPESLAVRVLDLAFHPDDPATVYAGQSQGVSRSRDGGRTWEPLGAGVFNVQALAVVDSRTLVAGSCGIQLSTNGGATWRQVSECDVPGRGEAQRFIQEIWVDPENRRTLYAEVVQVGRGAASFANFLLRSTDAGRTWTRILDRSRAMAFDPFAPGAPAAITAVRMDGIVVRSTDGGRTWQVVGSLPLVSTADLPISDLRFDQVVADKLYVAISGGVFRSTDGGRTWEPISQGLDPRFFELQIQRLMIHPTLAGYLYASTPTGLLGGKF